MGEEEEEEGERGRRVVGVIRKTRLAAGTETRRTPLDIAQPPRMPPPTRQGQTTSVLSLRVFQMLYVHKADTTGPTRTSEMHK